MSIKLGEGDVILSVQPSLLRRGVSVAAMLCIALFFLYASLLGASEGLLGRALLLGGGAAFLGLAERFWKATSVSLELSRDALKDSTGRLLFRLEDVVRVDRGPLVMKPSNGVSVTLKSRGKFAWEPGLWWRIGRRLGIGGATAPSQARAIADAITLLEAERDGKI